MHIYAINVGGVGGTQRMNVPMNGLLKGPFGFKDRFSSAQALHCQAAAGCFAVMGRFRSDPVVPKHPAGSFFLLVLTKKSSQTKNPLVMYTKKWDLQRIPLKKRLTEGKLTF